MSKPIVAVVGRPNVGKSSFFNRLAGRRISIVEDVPGVTRDRLYTDVDWAGYAFTIIDTGGITPDKNDEWQEYILKQAQLAIDVADVVLMMVDGRDGVTQSDMHVAQMLRRSGKPVVLAVNKMENLDSQDVMEFYELGLGQPFPISCTHGTGVGDLLDEIVKLFKVKIDASLDDEKIKIAIVGRPNAGKSSITNRLLGEERVVVSDIAGTTRDAVDIPFRYNNKEYDYDISLSGEILKYSIDNDYDDDDFNETHASISRDEAKEIALNHAGVSDVSNFKIELDDNKYEIEFKVGYQEYEYEINATTGKIISYEIDD